MVQLCVALASPFSTLSLSYATFIHHLLLLSEQHTVTLTSQSIDSGDKHNADESQWTIIFNSSILTSLSRKLFTTIECMRAIEVDTSCYAIRRATTCFSFYRTAYLQFSLQESEKYLLFRTVRVHLHMIFLFLFSVNNCQFTQKHSLWPSSSIIRFTFEWWCYASSVDLLFVRSQYVYRWFRSRSVFTCMTQLSNVHTHYTRAKNNVRNWSFTKSFVYCSFCARVVCTLPVKR